MLKATVSGSFHRHMPAIYDAVGDLRALGVEVLSPSDPRIVGHDGEFLFVASDKLRSRKLVEKRHLEAIRASDFLWVVCPDGYTGPSTSGEILAAEMVDTPVFSVSPVLDITIGDFVERVSSMREAVERVSGSNRGPLKSNHALLNPEYLDARALELDSLKQILTARLGDGKADADRAYARTRGLIGETFGFR